MIQTETTKEVRLRRQHVGALVSAALMLMAERMPATSDEVPTLVRQGLRGSSVSLTVRTPDGRLFETVLRVGKLRELLPAAEVWKEQP